METCQSGLSCFLAKEVGWLKPPEVRILSSPPETMKVRCASIGLPLFLGGGNDEKRGRFIARSEARTIPTGGVETVRPQEDSLNPNEDRQW